MHSDFAAGRQERILLALARDPFDNPESQFARAVLATRVEKANADTVAARDLDQETADWAASAITGLQSVLARSNAVGIEAAAQQAA
jgi:hypothetical protein